MFSKRTKKFELIDGDIFSGVTGSTIIIDSSGDSEGNFSVLALKPYKMIRDNFSCDLHMVPIAYFQQGEKFPVSEFFGFFFSLPFYHSLTRANRVYHILRGG